MNEVHNTQEEPKVPGKQQVVPVLEVRQLTKTFLGQRALDDVALDILPGEVHGLLGQNGSGKSTFIKILAGFHDPDPGGHLSIRDTEIRLPLRVGEFLHLGMSFVHQDLGLVTSLSVAENLNVYELARTQNWRMRRRAEIEEAGKLLQAFGLDIHPRAKVESLSQTHRALLAIVRAVNELRRHSGDAKTGLLVLDEPTAFLPIEGKQQLFDLVRGIVRDGLSVLFVTHDLDEVLDITDRITVLRDGKVIRTGHTDTMTKGDLVELITGRKLEDISFEHTSVENTKEIAFHVENLQGNVIHDIQFDVRRGEIVGLAGLLGSGFDEVPYLLFGSQADGSGVIEMDGQRLDIAKLTPTVAMQQGIALLPADRQELSGIGSLTLADNVTILTLPRYRRTLKLDRRQMLRDTKMIGEFLDVRPNHPTRALGSLSGGNQQKVLLGKWLQTNPKLLLLHEPTQGIDVGARQQVFQLIRDIADKGVSVICISADFEQLALICDRVVVFSRGRVTGEAKQPNVSKDQIAAMCYEMMG